VWARGRESMLNGAFNVEDTCRQTQQSLT